MIISHSQKQNDKHSEKELWDIDTQKKNHWELTIDFEEKKEISILFEMKTDVFVINASNTNHEMNTQKTKSDFVENVEVVKNARTKNIVNIDWIDEKKKTVNIDTKEDILIFENRFISIDRFEKLFDTNTIDDTQSNQSHQMKQEELTRETINFQQKQIAWNSQNWKRKFNSWLKKKKKKKSQNSNCRLILMKMMKNIIIRKSEIPTFFKKISFWIKII